MRIFLMIIAVLAAAGCAQTSPERAARHYAYNTPETLNGNYRQDRNATMKQNLPMFQKAYSEGQRAKREGVAPAMAAKIAQAYYDHAMADKSVETTFTNAPDSKWHKEAEMQSMRNFAEGLKSCFLDGYNGKE